MTAEKKKLNVLQLTAVSLASVISMGVGSTLGIKGTYIGTGVGTMISGVLAFFFERSSQRAHDRIRKKEWFLKPDDEDATSMFPAIRVKRSQRPWLLAGMTAGAALLSAGIAFATFGIVRATAGTTLGNYSPQRPRIVSTVTETPSDVVTPTFTETVSPSFSESYTPTPSPIRTTVTPTPTVTVTASPRATISITDTPSPSLTTTTP